MDQPRRVLVVAGSDNSGGAGLEADQKVIAAHGCYAQTATTALTAQDTNGVYDVHHVPGEFLAKLIKLCVEDIGVDVVKTGMLASVESIKVVAESLEKYNLKKVVIDPVMVATSGAELLPRQAVRELISDLLPHATVLTPNVPEARLLLSEAGQSPPEIRSVEDLETIGRAARSLGPEWVLVKGGHTPMTSGLLVAETDDEREVVVDVLCGPGDTVVRFETPFQGTKNTHGTGCSLASAIASNMANGLHVIDAVRKAVWYIEAAIRTAPDFGKGHGPLNHFHSTYKLPFAPGRFIDYLLDRPDVRDVWKTFVYHPFVMAMGAGTLPVESFKGYLIQDYLYLVHFARANALASYKAKQIEDVVAGAKIVQHIAHEMKLHIDYCAQFGITVPQIEATMEHQACTAYTRYVLDVGQSEGWLALQVALAPCLLGYGAVGKQLHADPATVRQENTFWPWIENYVAEDYVAAVRTGSELMEKHAAAVSPSGLERLVEIFIHATKMEIGFWEMFPCQ
ncbi:phosphomethylpyrimidine kinase THI20 [Sodiomyces alkalinus F11]|uniref:Phosphomethylpyrimidine kinase THI20 n=1 Tax=Sodiomyces alkalinus (strain CBS 110278 / VKM F-3762 / F11) TaxID=1314773 RepID=A0A3N2Q5Z4_SODAK|nr:phosphomethylpyrimidine kinase THI20 [Sodiomyces alkalinus F11]ROT42078.1 phosphomethylpyrimidine kinase THI20 [Sodiomyces alkalinus F11]